MDARLRWYVCLCDSIRRLLIFSFVLLVQLKYLYVDFLCVSSCIVCCSYDTCSHVLSPLFNPLPLRYVGRRSRSSSVSL